MTSFVHITHPAQHAGVERFERVLRAVQHLISWARATLTARRG